MPPVAAAIGAVATFITTAVVGVTGASLLAAAVIHSVISFTLKTLLVMAAEAALSMLTRKPKNQVGTISQGMELKLKLDPSMPRQLIAGRNATGGSVVWSHTHTPAASKVPNECLKRVIALSDYPVLNLVEIRKGTELLEWTSPPAHAERIGCTSHFKDKSENIRCYLTFYNGTQTTADPTMTTYTDGLWTANHIGRGVAYVVMEYYYEPDAFNQGEPELTFILDGVLCYDDRKDGSKPGRTGTHRLNNPATWEFSDNAAVLAAQVMRGWRHPYNQNVLMFGVQADERDLDDAMLLSAYNTCDELTDRFAGYQEKRYRANINLNCAESAQSVLQDLQSAMDGRIIDRGGSITILPGAEHTPVMHFTDENLIPTEQKSWQPKASVEDLTNYITGTFVDGELRTYGEKAFPTLSNPTWEADDGDQRFITQISFRAVHSWGQVQRITKRMHLASRQQATVAFVAPISTLEMEQGDWFTQTSERWGFTGKYFEVQGLYITQDLKCAVIGREVDPDNEVWNAAVDEKPRTDTTWNPNIPLMPVPIFVLTPTTVTQGAIKIPGIIFYQEDSNLSQETQFIEVTYCLTADELTGPYSQVPLFPAAEGSMLVPGTFLPDENYSFKARNIGSSGRASEWSAWESVLTDPDFFVNLIEGLGDLATEDQVDWASQVTGVGKPQDDATLSRVFRQAATPTGANINDIWVKLNGSSVPIEVYAWNGTVWVKGADITSFNVASGITGQGTLATLSQVTWAVHVTGIGTPEDYATRSRVFRQATAPTGVNTNDIWVKTISGVAQEVYVWNGSTWVKGSDITLFNVSTGITGQGVLATLDEVTWATMVTGVGKPEDYATLSRVYRQMTAPSLGINTNDIWVKINGSSVPIEVYAWNGSTWVKGSDITLFNTASGITGQGVLATLNVVTWATQVTGTGKPEDFANRVLITRSASAPGTPGTNDIWVKTVGGVPQEVNVWNGSVWVKAADTTSFFTALAIAGQGTLATLNQATWATQVTGTGKPEDFANKVIVYRQASTPGSSIGVNDIWVKLNGSSVPIEVYAWNGTVWVKGSDVTLFHVATGITGQGGFATSNYYYQSSDPGAVAAGSIWADTSGAFIILKIRIGGSWLQIATNILPTNPAFFVGGNHSYVAGSRTGTGVCTTSPNTVLTPYNAIGAVTYQWFPTSQDGLAVTNPGPSTGAHTTAFQGTLTALGQMKAGMFTCTATDSAGQVTQWSLWAEINENS